MQHRETARPDGLTYGFLTVVDSPTHGVFGGYLVVDELGRPVEFHCTTPVKVSRAQQILYGPTLRPYLFGEQIGRTLLVQSQSEPLAVFTDCQDMLAVREFVATPVALVSPSTEGHDQAALALEADHPGPAQRPHQNQAGTILFSIGANRLAVPTTREADRDAILQRLAPLGLSLDLSEPFGRIREAIDEAQKAA